jgi:hypothetical protein
MLEQDRALRARLITILAKDPVIVSHITVEVSVRRNHI